MRLKDRIAPDLRVLFVGINPGVRSAVTGHHFAGFSNRFWKLLHESGLVPEPLTFRDDDRMRQWGFGITNLIARPSPGIDTLKPAEYVAARAALVRKIRRYRPRLVALVGVTLFRALFPEKRAQRELTIGLQPVRLGDVPVFVLPNPSGRNANFSHAEMLAAFESLRRLIETQSARTRAE